MGRYTSQFREQAVNLVIQGQEPSRTARELGMPHSTLMVWLHKVGWQKPDPEGPISDNLTVLQAQVKELRRQLKRSEMEKDILKKATAYFASQNLPASRLSGDEQESFR